MILTRVEEVYWDSSQLGSVAGYFWLVLRDTRDDFFGTGEY